jgi:predicted Rdx family selenoprotein
MREMPGTEVELVRGGRGDFIVTAGETVLWDKKAQGGFPDDGRIVAELQALGS